MRYLIFAFLLISVLYSATYDIDLPANVKWTNSSIYINKGDLVEISADGYWQYDPRPQFKTDADGLVKDNELNGRLQAKIGDEVFFVGKHKRFLSNYSGDLLLGMYDTTQYDNNKGSLKVHIVISSPDLKSEIEVTNKSTTIENVGEVGHKIVKNITEKIEESDKTTKTVCVSIGLVLVTIFLFARDLKNTNEEEESDEPPKPSHLRKADEI